MSFTTQGWLSDPIPYVFLIELHLVLSFNSIRVVPFN